MIPPRSTDLPVGQGSRGLEDCHGILRQVTGSTPSAYHTVPSIHKYQNSYPPFRRTPLAMNDPRDGLTDLGDKPWSSSTNRNRVY